MTQAEIIERAGRGYPLPEGLCLPEQWFYLALRSLYYQFGEGMLSAEEAAREKGQLLQQHEMAMLHWRASREDADRRNRLSHLMSGITKEGCPKCKLAVEIFTGLDRAVKGVWRE